MEGYLHTAAITSSILHWEEYDVVAGYPKDPVEIILLCVLSWCVSPCFPAKFGQCSPSPVTPAFCLFHHGSPWPSPHTFSHHPSQTQVRQQSLTPSQGWTKSPQLRLRHAQVLAPCRTRSAESLVFSHASGKITLNRTVQSTHFFTLAMLRPIL